MMCLIERQAELLRLEAEAIAENVSSHLNGESSSYLYSGMIGRGSTKTAIADDLRKLRRDALVLMKMLEGEGR